tara:strand:+ start:424 stop:663 length:240 start_codon:yes stop_codon:yes gene_type:complete
MPSIIFSYGDTSKEVALSEVNSVDDVASNMKEVMTNEELSLDDYFLGSDPKKTKEYKALYGKEKKTLKDSPHKKNTTNG